MNGTERFCGSVLLFEDTEMIEGKRECARLMIVYGQTSQLKSSWIIAYITCMKISVLVEQDVKKH